MVRCPEGGRGFAVRRGGTVALTAVAQADRHPAKYHTASSPKATKQKVKTGGAHSLLHRPTGALCGVG